MADKAGYSLAYFRVKRYVSNRIVSNLVEFWLGDHKLLWPALRFHTSSFRRSVTIVLFHFFLLRGAQPMLYDNDNEMSLINLTTMKTTFGRFYFNYGLFSRGFTRLGHVPRRLLKQDYLFLHVGCPSCGPTHTVVSGFVKQGGSPDDARLEQTPYPFQPH